MNRTIYVYANKNDASSLITGRDFQLLRLHRHHVFGIVCAHCSTGCVYTTYEHVAYGMIESRISIWKMPAIFPHIFIISGSI